MGIDLPLSNVVFFDDALRLSGFYLKLKNSSQDSSTIEKPLLISQAPSLELLVQQWCRDNNEAVPSNLDQYARALDFAEGKEELHRYLART